MGSLNYTFEFVAGALPAGCARILEIVCGDGQLARRLGDDGLEVIAVDIDPTAVAQARQRGVDARQMSWPGPVEDLFDVVLFTRSLHHIHELDDAVAAAVAALRPRGRIIVEDFRAEGNSGRSDAWFEAALRRLQLGGHLREGASVAAILDRSQPAGHEHHLHSSAAIAEALRGHGELKRTDAAYYFRYAEPDVRIAAMTDAFLREELKQIDSREIDAPGQRFVLTPSA